MDPITQAALGAAAGHALFHRQLGTRAMAIGAVAGAFPDVDAFWGLFEGPFGRLVSHRGITHSLFFGPVVGSLAGWVWWRRERGRARAPDDVPDVRTWMSLFIVALMSHPLLDWFTTFGTQLLAPVSRARFALNGISIVDPVYSGVLLLGLLLGWLFQRRPTAGRCAAVALALSTAYLFVGLWINVLAEREAERQLADADIRGADVRAFPTMLQLPHRRVVAITRDETVGGVCIPKTIYVNFCPPQVVAGEIKQLAPCGIRGKENSPTLSIIFGVLQDIDQLQPLAKGLRQDAQFARQRKRRNPLSKDLRKHFTDNSSDEIAVALQFGE